MIERIRLGEYPTAVEKLGALSVPGCALWVKRDDKTAPKYGGNKVRKLERILADAKARGAKKLVTVGAVGSHHVLATAIYGAQAGFEVEAALVPQPSTPHVAEVISASLAQGLVARPCRSFATAGLALAAHAIMPGTYFVTVGGSSVTGSMGYVDAARELAAQVRAGEMPEPDLVVVTLGSGGTVAGLAAGLEMEGLRSRVVGVVVSDPWWFVAWNARRLARACVRRAGKTVTSRRIAERLEIDRGYRGAGYGHPTEKGARATEIARTVGLTLDPTYTAKAFAAAIDRVDAWRGSKPEKTVLYWHTLSSAPIDPLFSHAPRPDLAPGVRGLLR